MPTRETGPRQTTPALRILLAVAGVLVFIAGVQLFVLARQTERYFAWTINPPLTAAFLGAAYWSSLVITVLGARERVWARVRCVVPSVLTFTTLTGMLTLMHLDRFHFDAERGSAQVAAWAWLAVYVIVPLVGIPLYIYQLTRPGVDPRDSGPLPAWLRGLLFAQGAVMLTVGVLLFVAPLRVAPHVWPWTLSELTGRAVGAWIAAISTAALLSARENDLRNTRIGTLTWLALGVLELLALLRFRHTPDWSTWQAWFYLAFLISIVIAGGGALLAERGVAVRGDTAPATPAP